MNNDQRRLADILIAIADATTICSRGRAACDADPLVVRAAKNIVTEIGEAAKALSATTSRRSLACRGGRSPGCATVALGSQ